MHIGYIHTCTLNVHDNYVCVHVRSNNDVIHVHARVPISRDMLPKHVSETEINKNAGANCEVSKSMSARVHACKF